MNNISIADWLTPLYGIILTIAIYYISMLLHRRWRWIHPLFLTSISIIFILLASNSYERYQVGGDMLVILLGPATVALGVPLYKQLHRMKGQLKALFTSVLIGCSSGVASAGLMVYWLRGSEDILWSMIPKSTTTPISVEIVRLLGGIPELGAVLTVITGLIGSMIGPEVLRWLGIKSNLAIGAAIGTAAHGIGTARLIRESEIQGSISAVSMGLSGLMTSIMMIPFYI